MLDLEGTFVDDEFETAFGGEVSACVLEGHWDEFEIVGVGGAEAEIFSKHKICKFMGKDIILIKYEI